MKNCCIVFALPLVLVALGCASGQSDDPAPDPVDPAAPQAPVDSPESPEAAPEDAPEDAPPAQIKRMAPGFNFDGTGDAKMTLNDARRGAIAMIFYGDDEAHSAFRIVGACRDQLEMFKSLRAQLCLAGTSSIESHQVLLQRLSFDHPLFVDKRGESQEEFGLDPSLPGWVVISKAGEIAGSDNFEGEDSESVQDAIALVFSTLKLLMPPDAPNFVAVLGQPLDEIRDMATMLDGRVAVMVKDKLIWIIGDTNEVVEVEGGGLNSMSVDQSGMLYFAAGSELRMVHETEGITPVWMAEDENSSERTETIQIISTHASAAIMFMRGGRLFALMPGSGRVVPMLDSDGVVDMAPTSDNSLLIVRNQKPYLQVLDIEQNLVDLADDEKLIAPPTSAVVDPAGRIFVALRGENAIQVLDTTGRVINSFPVRGGGIEGTPLMLSLGAGYLDAAVRDKETKKIRIMRFAM